MEVFCSASKALARRTFIPAASAALAGSRADWIGSDRHQSEWGCLAGNDQGLRRSETLN
jgi:hypothetical protein